MNEDKPQSEFDKSTGAYIQFGTPDDYLVLEYNKGQPTFESQEKYMMLININNEEEGQWFLYKEDIIQLVAWLRQRLDDTI